MPTISPSARIGATLIFNFAERESKARYKRSILGWAWSFINPLVTVAIYNLVFGVFFRAQAPATDNGNAELFALWVFSGLVGWTLFTNVVNGAMMSMAGVSDLRKKIYFPTETAILGGAVSTGIQTLLEAVVLITIMLVLGNLAWTVVFLPIALILILFFGLGIGFVVAILNTRYRDVAYLVSIILNVTFFLVPIVFTPDLVPDTAYGLPVKELIEINPMAVGIGIIRDSVYFNEVPPLLDFVKMTAWAAVSFTLGLLYFRRRSMEISEEP